MPKKYQNRKAEMKKPWAGRFKEKTADIVEDFTESVSFDWRLWPYDIEGSIAHARMLARQGIIKRDEANTIIEGLREIAGEIASGRFRWDRKLEDVHMNIETALTRKVGAVGGKLHTARSRNDQVALDTRLYLREETRAVTRLLTKLGKVLLRLAKKHINTAMPGYTHLQRAQPVSFSQHLLAYVEMLQRDRERLEDALKRINTLPLGACALAGTTLPTDRTYLARLLKFERIAENSMDAVSDRDFAVEFLSSGAILMMHLSRMAEELVLWSTDEFSFIELPDAYTTGSSIMPQKKNPDVAELIRGKTGRVYGSLVSLLTIMKGLPLTYNRDMQEDKEPLFDTVDTLKGVLGMLVALLPRIKVRKDRLEKALHGGYMLATDLAEYLVLRGLPFRDAHDATGRIVRHAVEKGVALRELSLEEMRGFSPLIDEDVFEVLKVEDSLRRRKSRGGTSPDEVKRQIQRLEKLI